MAGRVDHHPGGLHLLLAALKDPWHPELLDFRHNGFLVRRKAVSRTLCDEARALVEEWLDRDFDVTEIERYGQTTFAPALGDHDSLLRVYGDSAVRSLAESLVEPEILRPVTAVQIQIRLPDPVANDVQPAKAMHVDGVACPHLDLRELRTFTLLVGILLTDIHDERAGALRFCPGGHETMADWFRTRWKIGDKAQVPPEIDAQRGIAFLGNVGDAVFLHHLVPHSVGNNNTFDLVVRNLQALPLRC